MAERLELYDYLKNRVDKDPIEVMLDEKIPCYFKVKTESPGWSGKVMCNVGRLGGEFGFHDGDSIDGILRQKIYIPGPNVEKGDLYVVGTSGKRLLHFLGDSGEILFRESDKIMIDYTLSGNPLELVEELKRRGYSVLEL